MLSSAEETRTPLQIRLGKFSRRLALIILLISAVIFLAGLSRGERSEAQEEALREALLFIKYVKKNDPNLPPQNISELKISEDDIVLFLMDRPFPIRLGRGDIYKKYRRLSKVLYWL